MIRFSVISVIALLIALLFPIPGAPIASDGLLCHSMLLSYGADQPGAHPVISYEGQHRIYHRVPLVHGFPLVSIQIIHTYRHNPCSLRHLTTGTLRAGFQKSIQPHLHGHCSLDAVDHQPPVTLHVQHSDDGITRPEQIMLLHQCPPISDTMPEPVVP